MRNVCITLVAVAALVGAAPASAHGLVAHPKCQTMACRVVSQKQNLAHAHYLCNYGRHGTKRWGCQAVRWLTRELNKTERVLHPRVLRPAHYDGWMCIHRYEGAWGATNPNGHYNGLQMTWGWGELEGNPNNYSPMQIIWAAEHEYVKNNYSHSWLQGQWGQTIGPCWGYFN